jgi:hypothetical protein
MFPKHRLHAYLNLILMLVVWYKMACHHCFQKSLERELRVRVRFDRTFFASREAMKPATEVTFQDDKWRKWILFSERFATSRVSASGVILALVLVLAHYLVNATEELDWFPAGPAGAAGTAGAGVVSMLRQLLTHFGGLSGAASVVLHFPSGFCVAVWHTALIVAHFTGVLDLKVRQARLLLQVSLCVLPVLMSLGQLVYVMLMLFYQSPPELRQSLLPWDFYFGKRAIVVS